MNLQEIIVRPVGHSEEAIFQQLMRTHHYLGALPILILPDRHYKKFRVKSSVVVSA